MKKKEYIKKIENLQKDLRLQAEGLEDEKQDLDEYDEGDFDMMWSDIILELAEHYEDGDF